MSPAGNRAAIAMAKEAGIGTIIVSYLLYL